MQWKTIDKFPGYEISDTGQIRNLVTGRFIKPYNSGYYKYLVVGLSNRGEQRKAFVAHLVAWAFIDSTAVFGRAVTDLQVNHKNGDNRNNTLANIEIITCAENHRHAATLPNSLRGVRNHRAKLTVAQVIEIRQAYAEGGVSRATLAAKYHVHTANIDMITRRKTWIHV